MKQKIKITAFYLALSVFVLPVFLPGAEEQKNLHYCIGEALKNNPDLDQTRLSHQEAALREKQAKALDFPLVNISGSSAYTSEISRILLDQGSQEKKEIDTGENERTDISVTLSQALYTGNKIKGGIRFREAMKESESCKIRAEENSLRFEVIKTYHLLAKFYDLKGVAEASRKQVEIHKQDALNQAAQGILLKNEILMIDLRLMDAEQAILAAENGIVRMQMLLSALMGAPLSEKIRPVINQDELPPFPIPEEFTPKNMKRPELEMMEKQVRAFEWLLESKKGEAGPAVSAYVAGHYGWPGFTANAPEWIPYWQAGINVSLDVFDMGKKRSEIAEAAAAAKRIQKAFDSVRKKIELDAGTARFNYEENVKKYQIARTKESTARENLRIAGENFKAGLASNSGYLDSQLELMKAENEMAAVSADLRISWADYLRSLGMTEIF